MGFFGLSSSEYTERISTYSDDLLRDEEISKCNKSTARNFASAPGLDLLFTLAAFPS
jgi:hypothetical protein